MLLQLLLLVLGSLDLASSACSYDDTSLIKWNTSAAWETKVPEVNEYAVIKNGKHVLLDVSPPDLKGITIEEGASLVWGNYDDLVVTTDHIHVKGKFIIGDGDCRFTKKAHIRLTGKSNTNNTVPKFGMKFIGVDVNGTVEFHGEEKRSWTKLIQTIKPAVDTCGAVFNFKESVYNREMVKGLFAMAFNLDGSVYDFGVFKTQLASDLKAEDKFKTFIDGIPTDKILVVAVNSDFGKDTVPTRTWETIYSAVETVGGMTGQTALRNVQGRDAYAFITKTGNSSTTMEQYVAKNPSETSVSTDRLRLYESSSDLQFSVVGTVFTSSNINRGLDMRVLHGDVAYPVIKLFDDVSSWNTGDSIVIAATDFDWREAEEFQLTDCPACAANEIRLDHEFEHLHYGEVTQGIDERAEVGMLTQSILIEGVLEDECYVEDEKDQFLCDWYHKDTHGGHFKAIRGFENVHVENVELFHMGQQKFVGSYALHFHMCDDVTGNWFRYNSIHHCETRCVTIHGTDHSEVTGNVCYLTKGHSIFEEDSAEQWNIIDGNLVIGTDFGTHLLSDMSKDMVNSTLKPFANALSSYWFTHPNNYIRNNVAAGSENVGFWFIVANEPLGPSKQRQIERGLVGTKHAFHSKIAQFDDCCAHSNKGRGLRIDHRISNGEWSGNVWVPENGVFAATSSHNPRNPAEKSGTLVTSVMKRFRGYKNRNQNVWTKAGNLVMDQFSLADSPRALAMARAARQTFTEIKNCLFIGESDNVGPPKEPWGRSFPGSANEAWQGIKFYQGPGYVTNCFFDKFTHRTSESGTFRPAGAVSFKRSSPYPSAPNSGVSGIKYGYCDGVNTTWVFQGLPSMSGFGNRDGNRQASFHDYDGSVTGTAGSQVVQSHPFFLTDRCSEREWWNVHVCPYEYARAIFKGKGGVFDEKDEYPLYLRRHSRPDDPFSLIGERGHNYLVMKNEGYLVTFNGSIPDEIEVSGENLALNDHLTIGFCFSTDSEFEFNNGFPKITGSTPAVEYTTYADLKADTTGRGFYFDDEAGILFVKLIGWSEVLNKENCPGRTCVNRKIKRTAGTAGTYECYDAAYGTNGKYREDPDETTPIPSPPACTTSTYANYGAPVAQSSYSAGAFTPTCPAEPTYPTSEYKGCFVDVFSYKDLPHAEVELGQALTVDMCVKRCYHKNYAYAALQNAFRCLCGDFYGAYDEKENDCIKDCPGNTAQKCGGLNRNSVWSTGRTPPADLATCRPDNSGAVINNTCYFLTNETTKYTDGQRACVKLGGNLATITSEAVQRGVEQYMRPKKFDAWFGLNDIAVEGTLVYVDGTAVGSYDNTMIGQGGSGGHDGYIVQANAMYSWNDRGVGELHRALCEMDIGATAPSGVDCGENKYGKKFGSGECYAILNTPLNKNDAQYACYTRMGSLVTVNDTNRDDVLKHVLVYGETRDYWTANVDPADESPYDLEFDLMYGEKKTTNGKMDGVICHIEELSANNRCSKDWKLFSDTNKCFLYTGKSVGNYDKAVSVCKQGASDMVKIHSEAENNFISGLVNDVGSNNVYVALKYDATSSTFAWTDGSAVDWSQWQSTHGDAFAATKGECVRVRTSNGNWRNRVCTKGGVVMCEARAGE